MDDIASLTWLYKLGKGTVNVAVGEHIVEIDVFAVNLKSQDCPDDVFTIIDTFMPQFVQPTGGDEHPGATTKARDYFSSGTNNRDKSKKQRIKLESSKKKPIFAI